MRTRVCNSWLSRRKGLQVLLVATAVGGAGTAFPFPNDNLNLALDVQARSTTRSPGNCAGVPSYGSCGDITQVSPAVSEKDIIVVAYRFSGITGIEFAVDWQPDYSYVSFGSFTKCSTLDVTVIHPEGRISTQLVWSGCQSPPAPEPGTGGIAVAWFRVDVSAPGATFRLGPTDDGHARITDCSFGLKPIQTMHAGFAGGDTPGPDDLEPCSLGPPTGACCLAGGVCVVATASGCASQGGAYQGDDTSCTPNPCLPPPLTGACCVFGAACTVRTAGECASQGGVYQGDGTDCDPDPCPSPSTGACCIGIGDCKVLTLAACDAAGGDYRGDGVPCKTGLCGGATATEQTTWGHLKHKLRR